MSGKLNTKDIKTGGGGLPKLLQPGNAVCTINSVELEAFKFKEGGYHLVLSLEGPDLGSSFEGFFIDKNDEAKGRHKGQVGQVKAGEWAFADGTTKSGIEVSRDAEILKFVKSLCVALGITDWLDAQDDKHETIESLILAFNKEKPFAGKAMEYCIGGKEYVSKQGGYTNHELFLPKFIKGGAPFSMVAGKCIKFDPETHIRKKKVEAVEEFGSDADNSSPDISLPAAGANDFSLD